MITNNINYISRISQIYNFTNEKLQKQKAEINFSNTLIDIQKSSDTMKLYNNYSNNGFIQELRESMIKNSSISNRFTQVVSEYPNSIQFDSYIDKPDGTGKTKLEVRIENCSEDTKLDEKELEGALEKMTSIANKLELSYMQMGYRLDDSCHLVIKYDENTGKIDIKESAEGVNDLVKMVADQIYGDCSKDESISKYELMKIKQNLEKVKKAMDDFIMKIINDQELGVKQ